MKRLGAMHCIACRGRGHTLGVFYRLPCHSCNATGFLQHRGRCVDTLAAAILAAARRQDEAPRVVNVDYAGWALTNRFRGD